MAEEEGSEIRLSLLNLSKKGLKRLEEVLENPDTGPKSIESITFSLLDRSGFGGKVQSPEGSAIGGMAGSLAAGAVSGALEALGKMFGVKVEENTLRQVNTFVPKEESPSLPPPPLKIIPLHPTDAIASESLLKEKKEKSPEGLKSLLKRGEDE